MQLTIKNRFIVAIIFMLFIIVFGIGISQLIYYGFMEHIFLIEDADQYYEKLFSGHNDLAKDLMLNKNINELASSAYDYHFEILAIILLFIIFTIFLTNKFLSYFLVKPINQAIKTLSDGVRQITDGNLDYRIKYSNKDEFLSVCEDFNHMAIRLQGFVHKSQADEESRKALIAGISHDLRTPLSSIKAYVEGLENNVANTAEKQKNYLNTIKQKSDELEKLIQQLFLFSKMDMSTFPMHKETVKLSEYFALNLPYFQSIYAPKALLIEKGEIPEDLFVLIDKNLFSNAIHNVLDNSTKYKNDEQGKAIISCLAVEKEKLVHISIKDNGLGVAEEDLTNIFDVFYRCDVSRKNTANGSGLGLAISSRIIKQLDGTVEARNLAQGGLEIVFTLPLVQEVSVVRANFT